MKINIIHKAGGTVSFRAVLDRDNVQHKVVRFWIVDNSSIYRGQAPEAYLGALPLARVRQVHVSGIRYDTRRGLWYDAHDSMREEDYALLPWRDRDVHLHCASEEYYFVLQGELLLQMAGAAHVPLHARG